MSHLLYGITVWGGSPKNCLDRLIKLQKKAVRHVAAAAHNAHTDTIFNSLNLLKFEDLYKFNLSTFMFNLGRGLPPTSIKSYFVLILDVVV